MDTTARLFALAHLLWPDGAWDVLLRADGPRVTAAVHSADAAGDDVPMARVVADDGVSALDALAVSLCRLASARARDLLAATGAPLDDGAQLRAAGLAAQLGTAERALATVTRDRDLARGAYNRALSDLAHVTSERDGARAVLSSTAAVLDNLRERVLDLAACRPFGVEHGTLAYAQGTRIADALRTLARRVDPQPAGGAVGVGAGVDIAARIDGADAEHLLDVAIDAQSWALVRRALATLRAGQPDRSADEGHEPRERGAGLTARSTVTTCSRSSRSSDSARRCATGCKSPRWERSMITELRPDPRASIVAALDRLARLAAAVARDLPADVHPAAAMGAVRLVGRACDLIDSVRHAARRSEP